MSHPTRHDSDESAAAEQRRRGRPLRPRDQVFGQRAPGESFLHHAPAGAKVATLAVLTIAVMLLRTTTVNLATIGAILITAMAAGVPLRLVFGVLRRIWLLLGAILIAQLAFNDLLTGVEVSSRVLAGFLAAHLLVLTTPIDRLLGVFRALLRPARHRRMATGEIVLAALVMLRAIPYLADQFHLARQQARARGLERSLRARTVPVILNALAYARDTGRALSARGIEEFD